MKYLLKRGANIKVKDNQACTALHYAAKYSNENAAEILVKKGIDINLKDITGKAAIHYASNQGHKDLV